MESAPNLATDLTVSAYSIIDDLCTIVSAGSQRSNDEDLRARISEIVWEHELLDAPDWMTTFFATIAKRPPDPVELLLPPGYPDGENGIANIFADIQADIAHIGVDDYGEGWTLDLPDLDVSVYVSREHGRENLAIISPLKRKRG